MLGNSGYPYIGAAEEKNTELLNFKLLMYDVGLTKKHFFN